MNTPSRTTTPLFGSSKIARAVITGVLTLAMGVTGLSSASATPAIGVNAFEFDPLTNDLVITFSAPLVEEEQTLGNWGASIAGGAEQYPDVVTVSGSTVRLHWDIPRAIEAEVSNIILHYAGTGVVGDLRAGVDPSVYFVGGFYAIFLGHFAQQTLR
jgi:hypothetical protein